VRATVKKDVFKHYLKKNKKLHVFFGGEGGILKNVFRD